ncbi:MFS transporter [Streptomyces sp. NPDC056519]|uniref:MFS transporter n=1 Tax=Streptomyces sp. NPDC056519 TaxID=3345849 RepID=UPI0036A5B370
MAVGTGFGRTDDDAAPLRKNREFNLLWGSQAASQLGSAVSIMAFPLLVLSIDGSPVQAGAVGTVQAVIRAVFQLPAGALTDRWNRKRLMLACDAGRAALFALLAAAVVIGQASLPLVFAVSGTAAVMDVLFGPAETAAISQLVPAGRVSEAFARNEARSYTAALVGPSFGGFLYTLGRAVPFAFDALSYLVSFGSIAAIRKPLQQSRNNISDSSLVSDIREGLRYVAGSPFLRAVILVATPVNFALVAAQFSVTLVLNKNGYPPSVLGLAQGVIAAGGLLGAFTAAWIQRRAPFHALLRAAVSIMFVLLVASALLTGRLLMVIPLALGLLLAPAINAALLGRLAATTPDHLQGRVISVVVLFATVTAAAAPLSAGLLVERLTGTAAMTACAAAMALSLISALCLGGLRNGPVEGRQCRNVEGSRESAPL